jgi:hypothetical protein
LHAPPKPDDLDFLLRGIFGVEDAGWKGLAGSSVLRNPGMFDFFSRQGRQLAASGQLAISQLTLDGQPIAFEYAYAAKGIYSPLKVGYDPQFKRLKPGQLLRWHLFRALHADARWSGVDFVGPLADATASWSTDAYRQCRMVIAQARLSSRLLLAGYRFSQRRPPAEADAACPLPPSIPIRKRPLEPAAAES